jgi:trimeric autotransporter adhesin
MKRFLNLTAICFLCSAMNIITAQNVGIGTSTPVSSAILDLTSDSKGLLIPRVALTGQFAQAPVTGVVEGMLVYNTNADQQAFGGRGKGFYYWTGFRWDKLNSGFEAWSLSGNIIFDTTHSFWARWAICHLSSG